MIVIYSFRLYIQTKVIYQMFHQTVFAKQRYFNWFLRIVHPKDLTRIICQIQAVWCRCRCLIKNFRLSADPIYPEGIDLIPAMVQAKNIVEVTIPYQRIRTDNIR